MLEPEPARTPLLREREPIGKVLAVPGARQVIARLHLRVARVRPFEEIGGTPRERGHPGRGDVEPPVIRARAVGEALAGPRGLDEDNPAPERQGDASPVASRQQANCRERAAETAADDRDGGAFHGADFAQTR